jgi:hypothetical protein
VPRRKKQAKLNETDMQAFLREAERLHDVVCRPLISPHGEHYRVLRELNQAISIAVREITGHDPDWIGRSSSGPSRGRPD